MVNVGDTRGIIGLLAFLLAECLLFFAVGLVLTQADKQPVRGRQPMVLVAVNILTIAVVAITCQKMMFWDDISCKYDVIQDYLMTMLAGGSFTYRAWIHYVKLEVTDGRVKAAEEALGIRAIHTKPKRFKKKSRHSKHISAASASYGSQQDLLGRTSSMAESTTGSSGSSSPAKESSPDVIVDTHPMEPRARTNSNSLTSNSSTSSSEFRFMKHRWLGSWKFALPVISLFVLIQCIPLFFLDQDDDVPSKAADPGCVSAIRSYKIINAGFIFCYVIVMASLGWAMRDAYDRFFIVKEFRSTFQLISVSIICWVPFRFVDALVDFQRDNFHIAPLIIVIALVGAVYNSSILPGLAAVNNPLLQRSSDMVTSLQGAQWEEPLREMSTLDAVLQDAMGFDAFKHFLMLEFSVENILFWREVDVYKSLALADVDRKRSSAASRAGSSSQLDREEKQDPDAPVVLEEPGLSDDELFRLAVLIYHRFVKPGSDFEVNLPSSIVQPLTQSFSHFVPTKISVSEVTAGPTTSFRHSIVENKHVLSKIQEAAKAPDAPVPSLANGLDIKHVFDAAQKDVYSLMERDSFPRFVVSREYKTFMENRITLRREHTRTSIMRQMDLA